MRILVVGAGAVGGYFGGRLLAAGRDVTFLVRPARARALAATGLVIQSPAAGDVHLSKPPTVLSSGLSKPFDLVILSCKAYDLDDAIASFAPAVGPTTAILPALNGMHHLDILEKRFGPNAVLGGVCIISSTLDAEGRIIHLNDRHLLSFGERSGERSARAEKIEETFANANFEPRLSEKILQEMWEKWIFITTLAGINCLMRASVGEIIEAGGASFALTLLDECRAIAASAGFAPTEATLQRLRSVFTTRDSRFTASMLRDVERGRRTEGEQVVGDLLRRAAPGAAPVLAIACAHLRAYEIRRRKADATAKAA